MKKLVLIVIGWLFVVIYSWSQVTVPPPYSPPTAYDITAIEYFYDNDPGVGKGVRIDVIDALSIDETFVIPTYTIDHTVTPAVHTTTELPEGLHVLHIRAKDNNGTWSLYERKYFFIHSTSQYQNPTIYNIVEAEYFFNNDPGVGKAVPIDVIDALSIDETFTIPTYTIDHTVTPAVHTTTELPEGLHVLHIRAKDNNGTWSLYERKYFFIHSTSQYQNPTIYNIVEAEYFFNNDPGVGKAVPIDVIDALSIDETFTIPTYTIDHTVTPAVHTTTELPEGLHVLHIRAKDNNGTWSLYERKYFFIHSTSQYQNPTEYDIVEVEYFFDTDTGVGNAGNGNIGGSFSVSGQSIDETSIMPTNELSEGLHILHIRTKDENDTWSLYERKYFAILAPYEAPDPVNIIDAEYFVIQNTGTDVDPGVGNATPIDITLGMTIDQTLVIPLECLEPSTVNDDYTLHIRVKDANGTWSLYEYDLFTVEEDQVPPTTICQDITIQLDEFGNASITPEDIDNGSFDACGIASLSLNITDFNCSNIGINPVILTVTDNNGNVATCNSNVIVEDVTPPTVITKNIIIELDANGNATIGENDIDNGSADACGPLSFDTSKTNFNCNDLGENSVILTVTDGSGNESLANAIVTVIDVTPPTVLTKDITIELDENGTASIEDDTVDDGSYDVCSSITFNTSKITFDCTNIGANEVILTVTDASTNSANNTAIVTVQDNIVPELTTVADKTENLDPNCDFTIPDYTGETSASDNCGTATVTQSPAAGTVISGHGTVQLITLTADDGNGNTAQTTFNVTLDDKIVPVLTTVADKTENLDPNCDFTIPDYTGETSASDNCGTATITQSPAAGTVISGHGTVQLITLTADDGNGNTAQTTFNVTLDDKIVPVLTTVADKTENLDPNCDFTIPDYTGETSASDNCGTATVTQSPAAGTVISGHGTVQLITLTADDGNGNTAQTTFNVTLDDKIVPVLTTVADKTENIDANCDFTIPDYTGETSASDNCGTATITQSPAAGTVISGHGTVQLITLTADDGNGNTAQTTFNVTLDDKIVPELTTVADKTENLDPNCDFTIPDYTGETSASDNCGTATVTQSPAAGTVISGHGTVQLITLTADDGNGNTAQTTFNVTLDDKIVPVLTTVADKTENLDPNCDFTIPDYTGETSASDNCGTATVTQSPAAGTVISGHGTVQLITLTADDGNGNTAQTTFNVTLDDKIVPVLTTVADKTENIDANCDFTIPDYTGETSASDNCGTATVTQSPAAGTVISGHGTVQLITLTADDGNGNTAQTTFNVTLDDKIVPVLTTVADKTENLDPNCDFTIPDYTGETSASDNCGTATITQSPAAGTVISGHGTVQLITLTADDGNGNTAQTTFNVTLDDKIVPVLTTVADKTENLDPNCDFTIPDYTGETSASDNCGTATVTQSPAAGTVISGHGTVQLITLTADDGNGNTAQTTFNVTLDDKIVPVLTTVADKTENIDANCDFTIPDYTGETSASDNCGTATITQSPAAGTVISGHGTVQLITLTADDGNGNTAQTTFNVTLDDKIVPVLTTVADKTENLDPNCDFTIPDYTGETSASDNCGTATITQSPAAGTVISGHGTVQLITLTADDGNGNTAQTTFNVTLDDKIVPVLTTVADKTENLDPNCDFTIPDYTGETSASDNCGTATVTQSPAAGTVISGHGTVQLITLTADDGNGNTAQTTFNVTLDDKIVPVLTTVADKTENLDPNCDFTIPDYTGETSASDNCGTATVTQSPAAGTVISGHGTVQLITLTADDGNGNTAQTTFNVTLDDKIVPVLTTVADKTENLDPNCDFTIPDYTGETSASDNCGTATITQSPAAGTVISGHGTVQLITLTADDGNGNTAQTTFNVTLDDKIVPVLTTVADKTENLDPNCDFTIPDYTGETSASDNCGTATVTQSPAAGTVISGHGTVQLITLTADDGNGNTAQTTFNVTLDDKIVPVLTTVADKTENLDPNCDFTIPDYTGETSASDNCGTATITQSPAAGTVISGHGTVQLITLTADDGNGNTAQTTFNVTLDDKIVPVLTTVADKTENLDPNCDFTIPDYTGETSASDNCGTATITQSPAAGTVISGHGTVQLITLTADDGNGNTAQTTFNVTLQGDLLTYYLDTDEDGFGVDDPLSNIESCSDPGSGYSTLFGDNCPNTYNPQQLDDDNDGIGNTCDDCIDVDQDGVCADVDCNDEDETITTSSDNDTDNDGINDCDDLEINSPCPDKVDANGVSIDSDNDGVLDCFDICPGFNDNIDTDNDGTPDGCDDCDDSVDTDNDGINDCDDLEINSPCPDNVDANGVSIDSDNDGVLDCFDICSGFNDNIDTDNDGTPDGCDDCDDSVDTDNDGINDCDDLEINSPCPDNVDANGVSLDSDNDGVLDCFDICPGFNDNIDTDNDGTPDGCDDCDDSVDTDNDGINDCDDLEINSPCPDNVDANGVSIDSDNDGVLDCFDICSGFNDNIDTDNDGTPDGCDDCDDSVDTDNDGINDCDDLEINSPCPDNVDANGVSIDSDNDGVLDCFDICPGFNDNIDTDNDGTPDGCDDCDDSVDTDNDGINDCDDLEINSPCPDNVDANGVSIDSDNDGVLDCFDICPGFNDNIDTDNDGTPDGCDDCDDSVDTDNDGINDCDDLEINSPCPDNVDANGVSIDSDNDGVLDCFDICPGFNDNIDTDNDGTPDGCDDCDDSVDTDNDGINDCDDLEINSPCPDNVDANGVSIDSDNDGVLDCFDICPGFNDNIDTDNDGTPDGCDVEECDSTSLLLSDYTIIGKKEVELQNSTVFSGGIGVINNGGKAKIKDRSTVNEFVRSDIIEIDRNSFVNEKIYENLDFDLPVFYDNNIDDRCAEDIKVRKRKTVILTEQIYKSVKVDDKGVLIIDTPVLYINELETEEQVTIKFNQSCIVLIDDKMKIGEDNIIDRNGFNVIFYVEDDVTIKKKSIVDANIYSKKDIEVKESNRGYHTEMIGLFIALDEIKSEEYVDWYKLDECPIFSVPIEPLSCDRSFEITTDTKNEAKFEIKIWPSPFKDKVSLKLLSDNSIIPVKVYVYDLNNRLVHYEEEKASHEFNFGRALESGIYIVKVIQGNNYKQIRIIKQ